MAPAVLDDEEAARPRFLRKDGSRIFILPDDVRGKFVRARSWLYAGLIGFYLALPFLRIGGHPAVHLDVPARKFYLLGAAYNAQDAWLIVFLLLAFAFALVFFTAWLGRVWCGWACPQTVFLEGVYRRIERWVEGAATQRGRLRAAPWTGAKTARFLVKHGLFLLVSLGLAHSALAFFVPVPQLARIVLHGPQAHWTLFAWAMAITGLLQFNFVWFREQLCFIVCPYGRFQAALVDDDSVTIGYDRARGEPRGHKLKVLPGTTPPPRGDCVDCLRCVRVCPTGIDIRDGLQLECIGCAQCIDACDEVMTRLGRAKGLIRYDSLNGLAGKARRVLRPRLFAYGAAAAAALIAVAFNLGGGRTPFEANLLRAGGTPYVLDNGTIRNQFELHLINKHPGDAEFVLHLETPPGVTAVVPQPEVRLASLESLRTPLFLTIDRARYSGELPIVLSLEDKTAGRTVRIEGRFIGPPTAPH